MRKVCIRLLVILTMISPSMTALLACPLLGAMSMKGGTHQQNRGHLESFGDFHVMKLFSNNPCDPALIDLYNDPGNVFTFVINPQDFGFGPAADCLLENTTRRVDFILTNWETDNVCRSLLWGRPPGERPPKQQVIQDLIAQFSAESAAVRASEAAHPLAPANVRYAVEVNNVLRQSTHPCVVMDEVLPFVDPAPLAVSISAWQITNEMAFNDITPTVLSIFNDIEAAVGHRSIFLGEVGRKIGATGRAIALERTAAACREWGCGSLVFWELRFGATSGHTLDGEARQALRDGVGECTLEPRRLP